MVLTCLIYFLVGLARDALCAIYYRSISRGRARIAGGVGAGLTAFDIVILALLIHSWSAPLVAAYAIGTGLGTYLIVKFSKEL